MNVQGDWITGWIEESKAKARALRRSTDPETSHLAAKEMVETGALGDQQLFTIKAVKKYPGRTARELAVLLDLEDPRTINRRLGEVERKGFVWRGEPRICNKTGKKAATWWPSK